ncbi:MAG: hypothetical protein H7Z72_21805 [Bacteroidetes bacterium]|nr:hypothetical protein [Fibrella sp.]
MQITNREKKFAEVLTALVEATNHSGEVEAIRQAMMNPPAIEYQQRQDTSEQFPNALGETIENTLVQGYQVGRQETAIAELLPDSIPETAGDPPGDEEGEVPEVVADSMSDQSSEELYEQFEENSADITSDEPSETIYEQFSEDASEITGAPDADDLSLDEYRENAGDITGTSGGGGPDYDELNYDLKP